MSKANKTQKTTASPEAFLQTVEPKPKREDCLTLLSLMTDITGQQAKMWGPAIIGFGDYHYKYDSGREGDFFRTGFAPRAQNLTVYIMPGYQDFSEELSRLGKHKLGKSCLYIKRLADIDQIVLREIIEKGLLILEEKHPS
tara:strand:- start:24742 stop:25164 length:423 start_codon:yes stop_codon:yes gene_type:complete